VTKRPKGSGRPRLFRTWILERKKII